MILKSFLTGITHASTGKVCSHISLESARTVCLSTAAASEVENHASICLVVDLDSHIYLSGMQKLRE